MAMLNCPENHVEMGRGRFDHQVSTGTDGDRYHSVEAIITKRENTYRCHVVEYWDSDLAYIGGGRNGRREVVCRHKDLTRLFYESMRFAEQANMMSGYITAISLAHDVAVESEENGEFDD